MIKIKDKNTKKSKNYTLSVHKGHKETAFLTEHNLSQTSLKTFELQNHVINVKNHDFLASFLDIELGEAQGENTKTIQLN